MSYNFLRDARSISNSFLCRYDSTNSYASDFSKNGDVDGWDLYNNIYLYGCWDGIIFGTAYDRECYIGRSNTFSYIAAETHFIINIMMKLTSHEDIKLGPTKGKIRWTRYGDVVWDTDKEYEFDVIVDGSWHLYEINVGPAQWWQGNINNLRVYPFVDGWSKDEFAIKYIKISSLNTWGCLNPTCSYYSQYAHPCEGAGNRGSCAAGASKQYYTTISELSDELIININDYGDLVFKLGTNENCTGPEIVKIINKYISSFNIGGYAYASVEYTIIDNVIKIYSGSVGQDSSVYIKDTLAAREFGFFDSFGNDLSINLQGTDSASGFDYASSRLLTSLEVYKLIDSDIVTKAYTHNPTQYSVEGGRRDFFLTGAGNTNREYVRFYNNNTTVVDMTHPIDNNGRINSIYVYGVIENNTVAKAKILRPKKDGTLSVIYSVDLPIYDEDFMYTAVPVVYNVECDLLVQKGDYIGIYNMDLYIGQSYTGYPDAVYFIYEGEAVGIIEVGNIYTYGLGGFPIYVRSARKQTNILIDVDMGERLNIEEIKIKGNRYTNITEFNIASCLDVNWVVNLFGETHKHYGVYASSSEGWSETHQNIAIGQECLNDCIVTADNGKAGDALESFTGKHSYFYVTGDAEWPYKYVCDGTTEFCGNKCYSSTAGYQRDPVEFILLFPYGLKKDVHKSIMYFKESDNFRNFSLSTYRGPSDSGGNAEKIGYDYIPSYLSVSMDGVNYDTTNNDAIKDYLFYNPTNSDYKIINNEIVNELSYNASIACKWNVLEHEFESVNCAGFRIYCNKHNSTKITELEVYSSFEISGTSLISDVVINTSSDNELWKSLDFYEDIDEVIAFVGGYPRYFRIEFDSQSPFDLNSIMFDVGDQIKVNNCDDVFYILESKDGVINPSESLSIKNIYDKSMKLEVDIPMDAYDEQDIIFWSKLGSEYEITSPMIGPPGALVRRSGFTIYNSEGQCAINTPCYVLNNMIHSKNAYHQLNESNWVYYDTLISGTSIDYINYPDSKKVELEFPIVSSKFLKIQTSSSSIATNILGITAFNQNTIVPINKVYFGVSNGTYGGTYVSFISDNNTIQSNTPLDYSFGLGSFSSVFSFVTGDASDMVYENIDGLGVAYLFANSYVYLDKVFSGNFVSFSSEFVIQRSSWSNNYFFDFNFTDNYNNSKVRYVLGNKAGTWIGRVYSNGIYDSNRVSTITASTIKVIVERRGASWTIQLINNDTGVSIYSWTGDLSNTAVSKLRLGLLNYDATEVGTHYVPIINDVTTYLKSCKVEVEPYFSSVESIIVELKSSLPLDKLVLFPESSITTGTVDVLSSNYNGGFLLYAAEGSGLTKTISNYYINFAIDLENRHDIDVIRNYGVLTNKLLLSINNNTDFSNTFVDDPNDVIWNNSTYDDVRWLRVPLLCGDGNIRCIRKIGVYPDISVSTCHNGGYNCNWESVDNIFTDYVGSVNVANDIYSYSNYLFANYPTNIIDGSNLTYWAFNGSSLSYIVVDLEDNYSCGLMEVYFGSVDQNTVGLITDFTIFVSTTVSGEDFIEVTAVNTNSEFYWSYYFDKDLSIRRVKFVVDDFIPDYIYYEDPNSGDYLRASVGYIREIKIFTSEVIGYVSSEEYPVVCVDLKDSFSVSGHLLINKDQNDVDTDWDNAEEFFKYGDSPRSDPHKVAFNSTGSYITMYSSDVSSSSVLGDLEFIIDNAVYLHEGQYIVNWDAYDNDIENKISLRFESDTYIDIFATTYGNGIWASQENVLHIIESGYYVLKGIQHIDSLLSWGVRNINIYGSKDQYRWVAITRDTAENYSYDDDSSKYGEDYLNKIKVFSNNALIPTEYSWWWLSTLSSLSNNYIYTKENERSLQVDYPTSSGIDIISFIEGDSFGHDNFWSIKDYFSFWWFISDVDKLDVDFGEITFGIYNVEVPIYYSWDIKDINLNSGWNNIKLKFEDFTSSVAGDEFYDSINYNIDSLLDFKNNTSSQNADSIIESEAEDEKNFQSFRLRYRGKGEPFTMYLDDMKIVRCEFETVKYGDGLSLYGDDFLNIPITNISLEKGAVEFWYKFYTDDGGYDIFNTSNTRTLLTITNNNNDIVSLVIAKYGWFEVLVGNLRDTIILSMERTNVQSKYRFKNGDIAHLALVWSNSGDIDNGDTVRFYINGDLVLNSTYIWEIGDSKSLFLKFGGALSQINNFITGYDGCGAIDNVKVYNYCKESFDINKEGVLNDKPVSPNEFIEISNDDNLFYSYGSDNLPLIFDSVNVGEEKIIYIRTNRFSDRKSILKTANLSIDWTLIV